MQDIFSLTGKIILVTGASSGIGRAVAQQCAAAGATCILTARNQERLQQTLDSLDGEGHSFIAADLSTNDSVQQLVSALPKVNGIICCAGVVETQMLKFAEDSDLLKLFNSNAFSAVGSGGKGAKLIMDGTQRDSAGQTRIQGGAKNLQSLTASIGKIGGDLSSLAEYTNSIGKIGEGVASLAEQYTNSIQPYIEATGTWDVDAIKEANTELQSQVKAFDGTQNPNNQNGQEFNYDSSKFRKAFGL